MIKNSLLITRYCGSNSVTKIKFYSFINQDYEKYVLVFHHQKFYQSYILLSSLETKETKSEKKVFTCIFDLQSSRQMFYQPNYFKPNITIGQLFPDYDLVTYLTFFWYCFFLFFFLLYFDQIFTKVSPNLCVIFTFYQKLSNFSLVLKILKSKLRCN